MKYTILGYKKQTSWDKVYFEVEALTPQEALDQVIDCPEHYETGSKEIDGSYDADYEDQDEWRVLNVTTTKG